LEKSVKLANLSLFLFIAFTDIFIKPILICKEANRCLVYPLKQAVPHSSDLALIVNGVAIFFIL